MILNFMVAGILAFFGYLIIFSTVRSYPAQLTSIIGIYYRESLPLTGAYNAVVAILLDFRAYDTLGEILVIFVTISGIILLIGRDT